MSCRQLLGSGIEILTTQAEQATQLERLGAMQLAEMVLDRTTKAPAPERTLAILGRAAAHGLLLIRAGLYSNCIRLLPPLVITDEQLDEGLGVLEEAVDHVQRSDW